VSTTHTEHFTLGAVSIRSQPAYQAYQVFHIGFSALAIVAGLDKFFDVPTKVPASASVRNRDRHHFGLLIGMISDS